MTEYNVHLKGGQTVRINLLEVNFEQIINEVRANPAISGPLVLSPTGKDSEAHGMFMMCDVSAIVRVVP